MDKLTFYVIFVPKSFVKSPHKFSESRLNKRQQKWNMPALPILDFI